jgi:hypothetical protein
MVFEEKDLETVIENKFLNRFGVGKPKTRSEKDQTAEKTESPLMHHAKVKACRPKVKQAAGPK